MNTLVVTPPEAGQSTITLKKYTEINTRFENDMYVESTVLNIMGDKSLLSNHCSRIH